ncbi:MAG: periplasmic heavy metal sensor [Verrucomicrobiaceae bacterium]|nr:periplasmic heavy metal sensor [Verrucomicrobiaceae bacterium]
MKIATIVSFHILVNVSLAAGPLDWLKPDALDPERTNRIKSELSLTTEQEARMQTLLEDGRRSMEELSKTLREQRDRFDAMMRKPSTPVEEGVTALKRMMETESAIKERQLRTILSVRDLLTPEQQEKAMAASRGRTSGSGDMTPFGAKAARVKAVIEGLGVPPTEAIKAAGAAIEVLVGEGKLAEAEAALDKFIIANQVDDPDDGSEPDFGGEEPGSTDSETLRARRDEVASKAQKVTSIPLLRKLAKAKTALETAVSNQDAEAVGRILTWAEKQMTGL